VPGNKERGGTPILCSEPPQTWYKLRSFFYFIRERGEELTPSSAKCQEAGKPQILFCKAEKGERLLSSSSE